MSTKLSTALLDAPPREFQLRDGARVVVRLIGPEDQDRLRVGVHRLSAASRYHRLLAAVSELSAAQLREIPDKWAKPWLDKTVTPLGPQVNPVVDVSWKEPWKVYRTGNPAFFEDGVLGATDLLVEEE